MNNLLIWLRTLFGLCPMCGGRVERGELRRLYLPYAAFGVFYVWGRTAKCRRCGCQWEQTR